MYKIRDGSGTEIGPVIADVVRQWIERGKAGPDTRLLRVGESDWRPLAEFPEFAPPQALSEAEATAEDDGRRRKRRSRSAGSIAPASARTSGWAIASLIGGLLGALILPALVGLAAGIMAHIKIENDPGRYRGLRLARAGMILAGLMMLIGLPVWGGWLIPGWVRATQQAQENQCAEQALVLVQALQAYAQDHDGAYPPAESWSDALTRPPVAGPPRSTFRCPSRPKLTSGFALNELLASTNSGTLAPNIVLLYESDLGWNGHGGPYDLATARHGAYVVVGFTGGSVERVPGWRLPQLRWIP